MGELNVYIRPETGALPTTKVWSTTGDQGDEWKMAQVTLTCQAKYEVKFISFNKNDLINSNLSGVCSNNRTHLRFMTSQSGFQSSDQSQQTQIIK